MKTKTVTYIVRCSEDIEVPDDWEWDQRLDSILEFTDMPFANGEMIDWEVS